MDIYSDLRIPFDVAVWARSHKFNMTAVGITRGIKEANAISKQIEELEKRRDAVEDEIKKRVADVQARIAQGE